MISKTKEYRKRYTVLYQKRKFEELKDKERELSRLRNIINWHLQFYEVKQSAVEHLPVLVILDKVDGISFTVVEPMLDIENISQ